MKYLLYITAISVFLMGCGSSSSTEDSGSINQNNQSESGSGSGQENEMTSQSDWELISKNGIGVGSESIGLAIERKGEEIFISFNALNKKNLFSTVDGNQYQSYFTNSTSSFVSFIDDLGRIYLQGSYTDDRVNFIDSLTMPFGGFINGDAEALIGMVNSPRSGLIYDARLEMSTDRGQTWSYVDLNSDGVINELDKVVSSEPAFNGIETFIVPSSLQGLWVSSDKGISWHQSLVDKGKFEVVTGNSMFPTVFYAIKKGELYVTIDSGSNWNQVLEVENELTNVIEWLDLELLDDGSLVAWGIPQNSENSEGQLYKTINNGQSWEPVGGLIGLSKDTIGLETIPNLEANSAYYFVNFAGDYFRLKR